MKIEIWSDIICPWCGLGKHRLAKALEQFAHRDHVEVIYHSFLLDPTMPEGTVKTVSEVISKKYGISDTQFKSMTAQIETLAQKEALQPYIVYANQIGNTLLAHEFLAFATAQGLHHAAWDKLYQVYFGQARSIFTIDDLVMIAQEIGLDPEAARQALQSREYQPQVMQDSRAAQQLGVRGVPFVLIDEQYALSGAQETATVLATLNRIWADSQLTDMDSGLVCGPEACESLASLEA